MPGITPPQRNASIVTSRPIVPSKFVTPIPPTALTSGSQINKAIEWDGGSVSPAGTPFDSGSAINKARIGAPWPALKDAATKFFNSWRPNNFREIAHRNIAGNYGSMSSVAHFQFRYAEYPNGIAGYPGPVPVATRPMWNNLLPIVYALRVPNPVAGGAANGAMNPAQVLTTVSSPVQFTPSGQASLSYKGQAIS
jgi:hypothetical protein